LVAAAAAGDAAATERLLQRHRDRVRRAIALRLDRRVAGRIDASDVLQETYLEAARRLPDYLRRRDMPFDLWPLWLAREQVLTCHRRHLGADRRDVRREVGPLPQEASAVFVRGLVGKTSSPSRHASTAEAAEKLRRALERLDDDERDLILWRHFEQLSNGDAARLLGIREPAASKRYVRALERLRVVLLDMGVTGA
jgi:RNA polymerase sigma-70 factor (ECF subfamily)